MTQRPHQALVIKPRDPFQGRQLHGFTRLPRTPAVDEFGLVQAIDGFGQGVIVAIAPAADRRRNARLGKPFAVADGNILRAPDALLFVKSQFESEQSPDVVAGSSCTLLGRGIFSGIESPRASSVLQRPSWLRKPLSAGLFADAQLQ